MRTERNKPIFGLSTKSKPINVLNGQKYYEMDTGNRFMFDGSHNEWLPQTKFVRADYYGISAAEKPINVPNGVSYYEMDTEKKFRFDGSHNEWILQVMDSDGGDDSVSGLPAFDDNDIGKTLTVVSEPVTEIVTDVQEQVVTIAELDKAAGYGVLQEGTYDPSSWNANEKINLIVDGISYECDGDSEVGTYITIRSADGQFRIIYNIEENSAIFVDMSASVVGGTRVISVTREQTNREMIVQGQVLTMVENDNGVGALLNPGSYDFSKVNAGDKVYIVVDGNVAEVEVVNYGTDEQMNPLIDIGVNDGGILDSMGVQTESIGAFTGPSFNDYSGSEGAVAGISHIISVWKPIEETTTSAKWEQSGEPSIFYTCRYVDREGYPRGKTLDRTPHDLENALLNNKIPILIMESEDNIDTAVQYNLGYALLQYLHIDQNNPLYTAGFYDFIGRSAMPFVADSDDGYLYAVDESQN